MGDEYEDLRWGVIYRIVFAECRRRLEPYYTAETHDQVRADPLKGVHLTRETLADPEAAAVIAEAADDACEGRRPRW